MHELVVKDRWNRNHASKVNKKCVTSIKQEKTLLESNHLWSIWTDFATSRKKYY